MHQKNQNKNNIQPHIPVLKEEVLKYLDPKAGETYLDLTAGYGGHADAILGWTKNPAGVTLVDRDQEAIDALREKFTGQAVEIRKNDFYSASLELKADGRQFNMILADLGVSSPHLDKASRGFAFMNDGPLDMRMDQTQMLSASDIVNTYNVEDLSRILKEYGEEPRATRIAERIRDARPLETTTQLAALISTVYPGHSRVHPATRTFQALRIAVNDELELLRRSIPLWLFLLKPGGRLGIISFHSLEDRIVKDALREVSGNRYDAELQLLTKRPITGSREELVYNPRARSAKLRAAAKIKIKEREAHAHTG